MHRDVSNKLKEIDLNRHLNLLRLNPSFIFLMDYLFKDLIIELSNSINIRNSTKEEKDNVLNLILSINYLQNHIDEIIMKNGATLQQELNSLNLALRTQD